MRDVVSLVHKLQTYKGQGRGDKGRLPTVPPPTRDIVIGWKAHLSRLTLQSCRRHFLHTGVKAEPQVTGREAVSHALQVAGRDLGDTTHRWEVPRSLERHLPASRACRSRVEQRLQARHANTECGHPKACPDCSAAH